jgi:hypothetical protein
MARHRFENAEGPAERLDADTLTVVGLIIGWCGVH